MTKILGMMLLFVGVSALAFATICDCVQVPEIDPGSGVSALALLSGALLITWGARKRRTDK